MLVPVTPILSHQLLELPSLMA